MSRHRERRRNRRVEHSRRSTARRRALTGAGVSAGALLGLTAGAAEAANFTVTNLSDGAAPGPTGSLRKAVTDANANPGPDQVVFDASLSGTILLSANPGMPITEALTISGPGADEITIDGYYATGRIFTINPATAGAPVTIDGVTLAYGHSNGSGGTINNDDAKLTISDSQILNGSSTVAAGYLGGGALVDLGNYASGTQTTIVNSTISGNFVPDGAGGAIGTSAQLGKIVNSTITSNYAGGDGGAIAANDDGGLLQNTTVARNYAYDDGGGIAAATGGPNIDLENTIVGGNFAGDAGPDLAGADPFDAEFSLVQATGGVTINSTVASSNLLGSNPQLPFFLSYSGGTTATMVPEPDTPVVDKGKTAGGVSTDQRGLTRPFDLPAIANSAAAGADGADMGAVEMTLNEATPVDLELEVTASPDPVTVGAQLTVSLEVSNNGPNPGTGVHATLAPLDGLAFNAGASSATCSVDPGPGPFVDCEFDSILSGATETQSAVFTVLPSGVPEVYSYGYAYSDQGDPTTTNNDDLDVTTVNPAPVAATPTPTPTFDLGAAIKKCKKKFKGKAKAKKRKKCIKKAKNKAAGSAREAAEHGIYQPHPFILREPPPALSSSGRLGGSPEGGDRRRDSGG
jgi:predicted outer membrane repeat protein